MSKKYNKESEFCRTPKEWWKDTQLIKALLAHPRGGQRKVAPVLAVLRGEASYVRAGERAGVPSLQVEMWETDLLRIVERDLWQAFVARQRQTKREPASTHPFVSYYSE